MRGRVVQHDRRAPLRVDLGFDAIADGDAPRPYGAFVAERDSKLLRVRDRETRGARGELAGVADLAAAFGIERRAFQHDRTLRALFEALHALARLVEQRDDGG